MNTNQEYERCQAFINSQLQAPRSKDAAIQISQAWRAVTISRQTGCGAKAIADHLAEHLRHHSGRNSKPWMVFDRNLVEKVLEEHNLPSSVAAYMEENRISELDDIMQQLFGLHPPKWLLVRNTSETILHLANLGNVILIGRGSNIITAKLPFVYHVRLVGSLERRIERLRQERRQGEQAARKFLRHEDKARKGYLMKYFGRNADDPMLYHLVVNTDLVNPETAALMIGSAVLAKAAAA